MEPYKFFFCRSISKILPLKLFLGYIFWGPKWITFWQKYFFLGWGTHQIVGIQKAKAYSWYLGHSVDPTIDQKNCYENSQETLKNSLKQQSILETLPPWFEAKFWHIWYVLSIWYFDKKAYSHLNDWTRFTSYKSFLILKNNVRPRFLLLFCGIFWNFLWLNVDFF